MLGLCARQKHPERRQKTQIDFFLVKIQDNNVQTKSYAQSISGETVSIACPPV